MIRDNNRIYVDGEVVERPKKIYNKEAADIKKEIRCIKNKLERHYSALNYSRESNHSKIAEEIAELEVELDFWKNEMNKFDNLPSHKMIKPKLRKVKEAKLREEILGIIKKTKIENKHYLRISNVARELNVKEKYVFQVFARLNREGVLSQAQHNLPHDLYRPYDSCWADDSYMIL